MSQFNQLKARVSMHHTEPELNNSALAQKLIKLLHKNSKELLSGASIVVPKSYIHNHNLTDQDLNSIEVKKVDKTDLIIQ